MTDIVPARPVAEPRNQSRGPILSRLSIGAVFYAMVAAVGQAFEMAYVAPYQRGRRHLPASSEAEDGRDPA